MECVLLALWIADAFLTQSNNVPHELDVERIDGCFLLHHIGRLDCRKAQGCKRQREVPVKMRRKAIMYRGIQGLGGTLLACVGEAFVGVGARRGLEIQFGAAVGTAGEGPCRPVTDVMMLVCHSRGIRPQFREVITFGVLQCLFILHLPYLGASHSPREEGFELRAVNRPSG